MLFALAVFFNAIAPLAVVAKEFSASDNMSVESLFGDKILICTPSGFKYINIDELHENQNNGGNGQQSHCPLCQINAPAHILFAIDLTDSFEFEYRNPANQFYETKQSQKLKSLLSTAKPRAPPFFL